MTTNSSKRDSNASKAAAGTQAQESIEEMLITLKKQRVILDYQKIDSKRQQVPAGQYRLYAPFIIIFNDNIRWAVFSTTSLRDRLKQNRWDSLLLKRFYKERTGYNMEKCYLVYPDGVAKRELQGFQSNDVTIQKLKESGAWINELDGIIPQSRFFAMVTKRAESFMSEGQRSDKKGRNFEEYVARILKSRDNVRKWNGDPTASGLVYTDFIRILQSFGIKRNQRIAGINVKTGNEIPSLPSGGSPKTDILVTITFVSAFYGQSGDRHTYTISCKNSAYSYVSAHQYSAQAFIDVLHIKEPELQRLLRKFEAGGAVKYLTPDEQKAMTSLMRPYIRPLTEWVVSGTHGAGNPLTQHARYIMTYRENTDGRPSFNICTADDYISRLLNRHYGTFGTPFRWTYQGRRGTNIQLKMPVL